jgi:hypothetical protein
MFPQQKQEQQSPKTSKQFLAIDKKVNWIWWQEEASYLFHPASQITEVKLIPASDNSFNVYARVDLKDRFEYKLVDNKKTLAAAKKLAEDFAKMLQSPKEEKLETVDSDKIKSDLNGLEALKLLKEDLKVS